MNAASTARGWENFEENLWDIFAYVARYGRQPLSELKGMTMSDLIKFMKAISNIVVSESRVTED